MIITRVPLRITLGGGGTDLPSYYSRFGGFVVGAAIDKYVYIYVNRPAADDLVRARYSRLEEVKTPAEIQHDLLRPALQIMDVQRSVEVASMADIPAGTGMGSSSAYLVGVLLALYELKHERVPRQALAELACHVEIDLAGHSVGKQDHYLATFGGLTCLEISTDGQVRVSPLNVSQTTVDEVRQRVLLFFTGIRREADRILSEQRRDTETAADVVIESLHRTKEIGYEVREVLERGDADEFGVLLHRHWINKKRRSSLISDGQIEKWYAHAQDAGAIGGKLVGAGGGGFLMFYCPIDKRASVRQVMAAEGLREMRYEFDFDGAKVLVNL